MSDEVFVKDNALFCFSLTVARVKRAGSVLGNARHGFWKHSCLCRAKLFSGLLLIAAQCRSFL